MKSPQLLSSLAALSVAFSLSLPAFAEILPNVQPPKAKAVAINPKTLRSLIVHNNFGEMTQLNLIHQAKDTVDQARGRLLPSLNLGAIISGITAGPAFALTSISFLLPFLLPSNW